MNNSINDNELTSDDTSVAFDFLNSRTLNLREALDSIVETTRDLAGSDFASCALWDSESEIFCLGSSNVPGQSKWLTSLGVRREGGATRWIIDNQKQFVVPDVAEDPFGANSMLEEFNNNAYAGAPVIHDDKSLGVIYLLDRKITNYTDGQIELISKIGKLVGIFVSQFDFYDYIQKRGKRN